MSIRKLRRSRKAVPTSVEVTVLDDPMKQRLLDVLERNDIKKFSGQMSYDDWLMKVLREFVEAM